MIRIAGRMKRPPGRQPIKTCGASKYSSRMMNRTVVTGFVTGHGDSRGAYVG
jgi:hypothetical protein